MKKLRVRYTVHKSKNDSQQMETNFIASDETAKNLLLMATPVKKTDILGSTSQFNLKTALYWNARLADCFFDMDDSVLSIKEVKK